MGAGQPRFCHRTRVHRNSADCDRMDYRAHVVIPGYQKQKSSAAGPALYSVLFRGDAVNSRFPTEQITVFSNIPRQMEADP